MRVDPDDNSLVRIYVKGAPEFTLPFCTRTLDKENLPIELDGSKKQQLLEDVISSEMASNGLKVISLAFKEVNYSTMEELMQTFPVESNEFREQLESDLIYLGTFGLYDEVREGMKEQINLIKYGQLSRNEDPKSA